LVGIISLAESDKPSKLTYMGKSGPVLVYHYAFQLGSKNLASEESELALGLSSILL
jgi:hypothetical protein